MSLAFPTLTLPKGLSWNYKKSPKFSTIVQTPLSGRHPAVATLQTGVLYDFELNFNYLKNIGVTFTNDVAYLQAFFEAQRGGYAPFLFDPSQNQLETLAVTQDYTQLINGFFGIADGATTTWPLYRSTSALGGGNVTTCELIQNLTSLAGIYVNGVLQSASTYTTSNFPATITFNTAPASGATLAWAGNYSYLARFSDDVLEFNEFMYQLWELQSLKMESINL